MIAGLGRQSQIQVGLDIGTTHVRVIVCKCNAEEDLEIIGMGLSPSRGMRKGVVINIEETVESIRHAVEEAEKSAGVDIKEVYTGIAGNHVNGINSRGVITVRDHEIRRKHICRVVEAAGEIAIPQDREILHVVPQSFVIDDQEGIKDPLGMSGVRLEVETHIITGSVSSDRNMIRSVELAGLKPHGLILQPLASSQAVLTPDEKDLGVALVDMGGGTIDVAVFLEGALWHTAVLPMGGMFLTRDIAIGLKTPLEEAERIKIRHGSAVFAKAHKEEHIEIPGVGGRDPYRLSRARLTRIIEPRAEEMFDLVAREIRRAGCEGKIHAGVVLTGGASMMEGMVELGERILDLSVRRGKPLKVQGLSEVSNSPLYTTGIGLVLYALNEPSEANGPGVLNGARRGRIWRKMVDWFKELF